MKPWRAPPRFRAATTLPACFWTWARWYLGRSEYLGHARDPAMRPACAPQRIPDLWWSEFRRRFLPIAPTIWQRRAVLVWNAENSPNLTADYLAEHMGRFRVAFVKIHDGDHAYGGAQIGSDLEAQARFVNRLKSAKIIVGGWGWLGPSSENPTRAPAPEDEARLAVTLCRRFGLAAYIADAEAPYEFSPRDEEKWGAKGPERFERSIRFVRAFAEAVKQQGLPRDFPRALTSYGRVSLHDLHWQAWRSGSPDGAVWRWLPQAYWNESTALEPSLCVDDALRYWPRSLVHPMIASYRGARGRIENGDWIAALRRSRTLGFSVFDADSMNAADYAELGADPVIAR